MKGGFRLLDVSNLVFTIDYHLIVVTRFKDRHVVWHLSLRDGGFRFKELRLGSDINPLKQNFWETSVENGNSSKRNLKRLSFFELKKAVIPTFSGAERIAENRRALYKFLLKR